MADVVEIQRGITELDRQKEEAEAKERFLKPFKPENAPRSSPAPGRMVSPS